jgi:hypothetical protein
MSILTSYLFSSFSDGLIPHLREPVEDVFAQVVEHKGLPTRQDFRELRNRVDMLDYKTREVTKALHQVKGQLKRTREILEQQG